MMPDSATAALFAPDSPVGSAVFYTAAITMVAAFMALNAALNNRVGLLYGALFAVMLVLVWVTDGGLVPLITDPAVLQAAGLSLGLLGAALGFVTAERAIDPNHAMVRMRRAMRSLAAFSVALIAGVWYRPFGLAVLAVNLMLLLMFASHVVSTVTWRRVDGRPFRLPMVTALLLLVAAGGAILVGGGTHLPRLLFALVAVPAMGAICAGLIDMRRSRDAAMDSALATARKEAETAAALLDMERNYARARDVAAQRTRQISTASHDMRQPLAALRAELDGLHGALAPRNVERLDRILDHFDALTEELSRAGQGEATLSDSAAEDVPAAMLFSLLERMFAAEAAAQGIELRFVASTRRFHAPAMVLMRLAANLVANAIAHSSARRILVGVHPRGTGLRLDILDDGAGFPGGDVDAAMTVGVKAPGSTGSGLGLSIVRDLADENGFELRYHSREGRGTAFSVLVPAAV